MHVATQNTKLLLPRSNVLMWRRAGRETAKCTNPYVDQTVVSASKINRVGTEMRHLGWISLGA